MWRFPFYAKSMMHIGHVKKCFAVTKKSREHVADPRGQGRMFEAVRDVFFACGAGEVLGLLDPNGRG